MKHKITYLLGAGASAHAIPVTVDFGKKINECINQLHQLVLNIKAQPNYSQDSKEQIEKAEGFLENELNFLYHICRNSTTPDTRVKALTLSNDEDNSRIETTRIKNSITIFFTLLEMMNPVDPRYEDLFAKTISKENPTPQYNIISWNYDMQFERAYSRLIGMPGMLNSFRSLNGARKNDQLANIGKEPTYFKLNGQIGFYNNLYYTMVNDGLFSPNELSFNEKVIIALKNLCDLNIQSAVSFAWEDEFGEFNILEKCKSQIQSTETLIIIGYSFPIFNNQIDHQIFYSMPNLRKIVIHAEDGDNKTKLLNKLQKLAPQLNLKMEHLEFVDQKTTFHVEI